ncbi:MAG: radical SAM/SPASM domain protein, ACGX system [Clostridia bacterium]|nr:radical SAM/SPASM domain protein, ACGX system [Clostridia bacterium]
MKYFSFQWHITEECDQRCKHCYIYALGSHAQFKMMTSEQMDTVILNIEEFKRKSGREPYLYITGGDPLLHPQFWNLLEKIKNKGWRIAILGNPFHITSENAAKMYSFGVRKYQLSLDGLKETHDKIRMPGSYDETIAKVKVLQNAGIQVACMATVSKWNCREIPALIDEVVKARFDIFAFARYCPSYNDRNVCCSPQEYRRLLAECDKKFSFYKDSGTYFSLKDHLWTLYLYEQGRFDPNAYPNDDYVYDGCNCGNAHFTILSDGSCYACRRMESKVGNALTDDLYDLFTGKKMDEYRVYEKFEKCVKCPLLRFCRGCPAVAYGYSGGNMYAPDPECWYKAKE